MWIELPLLVWLVLVWGAMWENFSAANLIFGAVLALALVRAFRLPPVRLSGRFDLVRAASFAVWFVWEIVRGSLHVFLTAVRRGPRVRNAIIEVPLRTREDLIITAVGHVTSLIPGSLVVDVDRAHSTLYLHVLDVNTAQDAERFLADVLDTERRLIRFMGTREELERLRAEDRRVAVETAQSRRRVYAHEARERLGVAQPPDDDEPGESAVRHLRQQDRDEQAQDGPGQDEPDQDGPGQRDQGTGEESAGDGADPQGQDPRGQNTQDEDRREQP